MNIFHNVAYSFFLLLKGLNVNTSSISHTQISLPHKATSSSFDFDIEKLTKLAPNLTSAFLPSLVAAPSSPSRSLSPLNGVQSPTLLASNARDEAIFTNDGDITLYVLGDDHDKQHGNYIFAIPIKKGESAKGDGILFPDAQGRINFVNGHVFKAANTTSWNVRAKLEQNKDGQTSYQPSATTANVQALGQGAYGAYKSIRGEGNKYDWMSLQQFVSVISTPDKNASLNDPRLRKIWVVNEVPSAND
jgi:hypothetical protein